MIRGVQTGGEEKAVRLASLRKALRNPETQLTFIKYDLKTNTELTLSYYRRPTNSYIYIYINNWIAMRHIYCTY